MHFTFRKAELRDVAKLEILIEQSCRHINSDFYSTKEIEAALGKVWTVDKDLIADKTYWVVENIDHEIIGCGGWSKRNLLFGKRETTSSNNQELNPETDSARIRAFFVHPDYKRMGIGKSLLEICEKEAQMMGFKSLELVATLSGEKLYASFGYLVKKEYEIDLGNGITNKVVAMYKSLIEKSNI